MNSKMMSRRTSMACMVALLAALPLAGALAAPFESNRITVRTEGAGPDVVLIPGLNSSPRTWASTVAALPGYRYHLVHVSGFAGQPVGGNREGNVAAPVADDIARYIRESNLKQPAVIGHSMGGSIGMMLASRHPDSLSRLMVVDMGRLCACEKPDPEADSGQCPLHHVGPAAALPAGSEGLPACPLKRSPGLALDAAPWTAFYSAACLHQRCPGTPHRCSTC